MGEGMNGATPAIEVRSVSIADAPALHELDYSFETDRIYALHIGGKLAQGNHNQCVLDNPAIAFELWETPVEPPLYKSYFEYEHTLEKVKAKLSSVDGGYVALADGQVAGVVLLKVEEWRSVTRIEDIIVGRQFRRYGIGSLLLNCASDWARKRGCWAIVLETQNVNYPAIQFYLRNSLEVWSIYQHFYPPGSVEHEVAIFMGKKLK
jgi:GNAT superfamily N-acetyltransferase